MAYLQALQRRGPEKRHEHTRALALSFLLLKEEMGLGGLHRPAAQPSQVRGL